MFSGNSFSFAAKYMCKILIDNRDGCPTLYSAAIPFPVRQSKCAKMLQRITTKTTFRNRLWIAAQEIEIPNHTHTWHPLKPGVSACLALSYVTCQTDSQVICISSHCLFEVKWSEVKWVFEFCRLHGEHGQFHLFTSYWCSLHQASDCCRYFPSFTGIVTIGLLSLLPTYH